MKRLVLKVLGFGVLAAAVAGTSGFAYLYMRKPAMAPASQIHVEMTPERIARGKYLFNAADCDGCHSQRDFDRFDGPVVESGRAMGMVFPAEMGLPGTVASRNITMDVETGIGAWTDGEKIRAIREGISRDGTMLFPMMPYERFRNMSDDDVQSLVAFLNTLPPVCHKVPRSQVTFPVSMLVKSVPKPVAGPVSQPNRSNRLEYGKYLVNLAGCMDCHTQAKNGEPVPGMLLAGGEMFRFPGGRVVVSANITPDPQTGIGTWKEEHFLERFYQYKEYTENGSPAVDADSFTLMPWLNFCQLPADDLKAIYAFLRTQKPIYHVVDSHPGSAPAQQVTEQSGKRRDGTS